MLTLQVDMNKIELDQKELGRRLQLVRRHLGLKQSEVAEMVGFSFITISRLERGENGGSSVLAKLLALYSQHISLNALFTEGFPDDVEEVFWGNRIDVPVSLLQTLITFIGKQHKEMNNTLNYFRDNFVERLDKAIGLL